MQYAQIKITLCILFDTDAAALQMKKACLTRRAEMMKDMDKKGDLPLSLLASMGKQKGSSGATQKRSPPAFAASRYVPFSVHS